MTQEHDAGGAGYADEVREHEFDGIQEFDNRLPNWWLWTFYGACIFAFFYWISFHVLGVTDLPYAKYEQEMAEAQAREEAAAAANITDESLIELSKDAAAVTAGRQQFEITCVSCHSANAGGMVGLGPNLTDKYWIHGGKPTEILHTITEGVPGTAMVAWKFSLDAETRQKLVAYVLSIRNTDVEGGQPPKGEPYEGQ